MRVHGIDFTSAPRRRKPITVAGGQAQRARPAAAGGAATCVRAASVDVVVDTLERLPTFEAFDAFLATPGPWVGGFDFPFGLPRELIDTLGWPGDWPGLIRFVEALPRAEMVARFRAFCDARPVGGKFAHRACDRTAGSSPSMKWVNPPVAFMLQAGVPRLVAAGLAIPLLHPGDASRIALEAYPGLLARGIVGRASYKSDDIARQTASRRTQREAIVAALACGSHPFGLTVSIAPAVLADCLDDASGDSLDAVLCLVQAAWAVERREANWGLPAGVDPLEGWILGA